MHVLVMASQKGGAGKTTLAFHLEPLGYARRLSVLPGISGPWQVAGRSQLGGVQMLDLDLDYVENWSVATDLDLLVKTVIVVLACRGAS